MEENEHEQCDAQIKELEEKIEEQNDMITDLHGDGGAVLPHVEPTETENSF
jgi:hypothetical protein